MSLRPANGLRIAMLLHKSVEFDSRVRREASALAAAGHEVHVLELAEVPRDAAMLDGFHRRSVLPTGGRGRRLPFHVYRLAFLLWFVREVVRVRPDVVHAHDAAMLLPGTLGAWLTGARLVYDSHELATSVPYRERAWGQFVAAIERLVVPRCAAVITVSDGIASRLAQRYRLRAVPTVVRNVSALELGGRGGLRARLGLDLEAPLVLHQGAPAPARGCEVLVAAVTQLDHGHLVFLGDPDGGYGEELRRLIGELGVEDRISLLPSVPLAELLAQTAEADVGVTLLQDTCENHRLALPNKLFEYIAAGIPVVASALPETERLVNEYGVGWCVPPADADALAAALSQALSARGDQALRERLARAADELRWPREQARLVDLYDRLGPARSGPDQAPGAGLVLSLVRNSVSHDARVLRAARTAESLGARALVIGVATVDTPEREALIDGTDVIRLRPRLARRRRRSVSAASAEPAAGGASPEAAAGSAGGAAPEAAAQLSPRVRARRIAAGLDFALQAISIARRRRPEIVHANDWNTMWAGMTIKLICGSRLIYDSHELWPDRNGRWERRLWLIACEAMFVRVADQLVMTSPGHARALAARYRVAEPLVVRNIPEGSGTPAGAPEEPPIAAYIGGLMPGRGLEEMIDALALLPALRLRAIGPGAAGYRARLTERAERLGVAHRVELLEAVAPDRVGAALAGATFGICLIQPICRSYELSLPNKLFEYVAAGLPILASDLPVIGEVVGGEQLGEVVSPDDASAIAAGARRLLESGIRGPAVSHVLEFAAANPSRHERKLLAGVYGRLSRS